MLAVFLLMGCDGGDPDLTPSTDEWVFLQKGQHDDNGEHPFIKVAEEPLSTFSLDVDTASYTNARGALNSSSLPDKLEIRTEEFTNYFKYAQTEPADTGEALAISYEISKAPWSPNHRLIKTIVKAKKVPLSLVPPLNLVFLIDVSGSMGSETKLELAKYALKALVEELREQDKISIVTYAGEVATLLSGATGDQKDKILKAIQKLQSGGLTAGRAGIQKAYSLAQESYINNGINRVILSTDGDFNVGITNEDELATYVGTRAKEDIYLTVHGYGRGDFNDSLLEKITNKGNGNYTFIDSRAEAVRVFKTQLSQTVSIVAKDAKIQVEFDSDNVEAYRLIGYENRRLDNDSFEDDEIDAGDVGSGHVVVALYEIKLKSKASVVNSSVKVLKMKLRYHDVQAGNEVKSQEMDFYDDGLLVQSHDHCFASTVAAFALKLRGSGFLGAYTLEDVRGLGLSCGSFDQSPERMEFMDLVGKAIELTGE